MQILLVSMIEGLNFGQDSAMRKLHITELNRKNTEEFHLAGKWPVRIILDNVRSLHNIGSVFRTSDAFLCEAIYLCGISATPPNKEIHKSALGAENSVHWEYFSSVKEAALKAQSDGYKIVLIEQTDQSIPLDQWEESTEKIALVFGNEVSGVSDEVLDVADAAVEIPQFGTKHSFNISVCAGIVLYQLFCLRAK
jgi:23S rRNA (guanosine2251-2'-O)-methyltransferase